MECGGSRPRIRRGRLDHSRTVAAHDYGDGERCERRRCSGARAAYDFGLSTETGELNLPMSLLRPRLPCWESVAALAGSGWNAGNPRMPILGAARVIPMETRCDGHKRDSAKRI